MKVYLRWPKVRAMEHPGDARKTLVNETTSWWRHRSSREQVLVLHNDLPVAGADDAAVTHQMAWQAVLRLPPRLPSPWRVARRPPRSRKAAA